jgi:hypothetical protein
MVYPNRFFYLFFLKRNYRVKTSDLSLKTHTRPGTPAAWRQPSYGGDEKSASRLATFSTLHLILRHPPVTRGRYCNEIGNKFDGAVGQ